MAAGNIQCCQPVFWGYLLICAALVCFAGLMSGLTLGLMSLSLVDLEIQAKAGKPRDRKNAAKILPIVKNQHLLLCTLLICNAMAMEALPIFLNSLVPAWGAILISVTLILTFGEIIPQAICSRYGLRVGAKLSIVVRLLVIIVLPISYPISKLLDWLLGKKHAALLQRAELKMFVDMHANESGKGGELTTDETTIITGALDLTLKTAKDAMTMMSNVFSLDINTKLDEDTLALIVRKGHSRVPIYSGKPTSIIGLVLVKNLINCHPGDETCIKDVTIRKIPRIEDCLPLYDILKLFQTGHSHMAAVVKCKKNGDVLPRHERRARQSKSKVGILGEQLERMPTTEEEEEEEEEVIGIITLEDVIEELLQEQILDETDEYVSVHNTISIQMERPGSNSGTTSEATALGEEAPAAPLHGIDAV
ncbi:hypothetical protein MLD38_033523 [Melastoma candidum]|uniref:Uncharacterized protein n=1 Tax=Melastoma candidum TaxID=119954 RepID=A0ACB9M6Q6_9MYRT|nr:hypothetical protein MLD38_033523 [Melastoma candidum]